MKHMLNIWKKETISVLPYRTINKNLKHINNYYLHLKGCKAADLKDRNGANIWNSKMQSGMKKIKTVKFCTLLINWTKFQFLAPDGDESGTEYKLASCGSEEKYKNGYFELDSWALWACQQNILPVLDTYSYGQFTVATRLWTFLISFLTL